MSVDPSVVYCTDEDICVRDPGNWLDLCPADQVIAAGTTGVISGWTLTDSSASFMTAGVTVGSVVHIDSSTGSTGTKFAVASVAATVLALRRIGTGSTSSPGHGQPPTPGSGISYEVPTMYPQIEDATYDLNRLFGVDDNFATKAAGYLYDPRELRQATVLTVLLRQYTSQSRSKDGDWSVKRNLACHDLEELKARIVLKRGPLGLGQPATTRMSNRITR